METERFAVPEVLFCPSDVGINQVCITVIILLILFLSPLECLEVIDGFHSSWFLLSFIRTTLSIFLSLFSGGCCRICLAESEELTAGESV
jgi:hypothetical protein